MAQEFTREEVVGMLVELRESCALEVDAELKTAREYGRETSHLAWAAKHVRELRVDGDLVAARAAIAAPGLMPPLWRSENEAIWMRYMAAAITGELTTQSETDGHWSGDKLSFRCAELADAAISEHRERFP